MSTQRLVLLKSFAMRIFTLTLFPRGASRAFAARTIEATNSGSSINWQPIPSLIAQDCGQPQLRFTPSTQGSIREEAREKDSGVEAANWAMRM